MIRAVTEHNLLSVSKIFMNISFDQLASILSVSPSQAEQIASNMMIENRLEGYIDQVSGLIYFEQKKPLETWNENIAKVCQSMDFVIQNIRQKYPDWTATQTLQ
jgi:COP9 signalosome complex subunit 4